MIKAYKKDQGRLARMAAFWSMAFLVLFGCMFLYETLTALVESLREPLGGLVIPIVGVELNGAFLISAILCVGGLVLLYSWHQKPKVADLLIETEAGAAQGHLADHAEGGGQLLPRGHRVSSPWS